MATHNCWGNWFVGGVCGCQHVATARQFISLNINALTSAASSAHSDATANEGRVNYDVSNVPAPTTGSGCHARATMQKIVDFFVGAHRGASTIHTPPTHT